MQSEVYLSSHGQSARTIALKPCVGSRFDTAADHGHVLYLAPHDQPAADGRSQVSVRLEPAGEFHAGFYRKVHSRPVYGCLGLMHHARDTFIALVTGCVKVGDVRLGESVYRIVAVKFFSLTGATPDEDMIPAPFDPETAHENEGPTMMPHPCRELEKVLCNGAFFFSPHFDLTRSIQTRAIKMQERQGAESIIQPDDRFLWNMFMLKELLTFRSHLDEQEREELDSGGLLVHIIQGYVGCQPFRTAATQGQISVISRLSSKRAGTRYNTRGIDDSGSVANFVETETIVSNSEWCFSYAQIRGSVPVFWEQQGLQLASHKIQLSRGPEAAKPAVRRHFEELIQNYEDVHILDLLGTKDQGEVTLSQEYKSQVEDLGPLLRHLHMTRFDYHSQVKGGNYDQVQSLVNHVRGDSERYGYFYHDLISNTIVQTQRGVFRTNCLDCLDRTNVIQSNLSKEAVEYWLRNLLPHDSRFASLMLLHSELWAENGDLLSKIYTGTGALKSEVTRSGKMSFAGMLGDATKSLNRFVINNFQDKDRQEVIDLLLGKMSHQSPVAIHDPVHDSIASEMNERLGEYSQKVQIDVFVGTYNLNGKLPSGEPLEDWLCFDRDVPEPDMYMIGFQEIVKLTARQIAATDENKRRVWEAGIEKTINRRGGSRYIQLRSVQLVGAALMIYVKEENVPFIRNVECVMKKTGLGGMAGNKGAVAIRMDYYETSLCLVTSHLASGQENLQERNDDFHTIDDGIAFGRGRNISSHDIILWCGDFNYRVDMENDQIRALVSQGNFFEIFRCDQLKRSIDYGEAFYGYKEGIIAFAPTYRYDIGTDNYDTSEKYRAPAWTDRILYRGKGIYQTSYERAEFRTSDHRPVMSMFVLELTVLDAEAKERMEETLYRKSSSRSIANNTLKPQKNMDQALSGLLVTPGALRNGLSTDYERVPQHMGPKPSSDKHQWWNEPLRDGVKRIPSGRKNPFEHDRTITDGQPAAHVPPSLRPAPPTPVMKKPAEDLLGGLEKESFDAPVLAASVVGDSAKAVGGTTVKADGGSGHTPFEKFAGSSAASVGGKRSAPPPPVKRRQGAPLATLPASFTIHKDVPLRRPAPPPPRRESVTGELDDDDDDDDDEDEEDNEDEVINEKSDRAVDGNVSVPGALLSTVTESAARMTNGDVQDTLLKPSQLKKQQTQQKQRLSGEDDPRVNKKPVDSALFGISPSRASAPLTTALESRSKVLLPGLEQSGSGKPHQSASVRSVASLGFGPGGIGAGGPERDRNHGSSVLQRTKEFQSKADGPSTTITPSSSMAPGPSASTIHEKHKATEETDAPGPSVSELKRNLVAFSAPQTTSASALLVSPIPASASTDNNSNSEHNSKQSSSGKSSMLSKSMDTLTPSGAKGSGRTVAPVIPTVKPLSFTTFGLQSSAAGRATTSRKVEQEASVPAATTLRNPSAGDLKAQKSSKEGIEGAVEKCEDPSAKRSEDGDEGEKVDAFAFWKSK